MEYMRSSWGLYVGMLSAGQLAAFDRLVAAGLAYRQYNCLGIAKAMRH